MLFKAPAALGQLYPRLVQQAILTLGSREVMRFWGAPVGVQGVIPRNFAREVVSDLKARPEGLRVKHRVGGNSVKMYDKHGCVLRTETTLHDPRALRVYRGTEEHPEAKRWRPCRKGIADLHRVAAIGARTNERYLSFLSQIDCPAKLGAVLSPLCQRVQRKGRGFRGLRPLAREDAALLAAVARGEWLITGFSNRQLRGVLDGAPAKDPAEEQRRCGRISRQLALLRSHGVVARIGKTRRWVLTGKGRTVTTLLAAAKDASIEHLLHAAA